MLGAAFSDIDKLEGPKRLDLELDLTLTEAMALRSLRGYSDPDVEERLIRARRLCADCLDASNRFNVEWGLFQCTIAKGDIIAAHQLATDLFHHAEYHPDRPFIDAHLASGMVAFHFGNFEAAMSFLEKGVSVSSPETDHPHFFTHGQSPGLFCISYLARTQCFLGYLDRARTNIERGLAIAASRAHDPGHIYGYVNALIHAVRVYHLCGDLEAEKRMALLTVETARRNHYAYYEALGLCHLGWVAGAEGSLREGIDMMVDGLSALAQTGTELGLTGFYVLLSQLNLRAGKPDRAREALGKAARSGNLGTRIWDADIERARGDILFWAPATDLRAAENAYRTSLAIARQQGAGVLVLKAALSLARLLQTLGRQEEGRAVLKHSLEQMQEGSDTQIAREARTVLSDLAGTIPS